ncbi:MAG: SHOCT domain-containing protein [Streptomyces sp.]|uniref:SHOCT domain-containing protein n=1 Tax=Streptomyces sp. B93 TaxID=2824875 RepID=UPI0019B211C2|nr:SHOCT domain-containing protein [Streptomyces sp. B93]MBC7274510.1 SHOCT domain-containing protein [Streptomyces sp.]MBQ1094166.1 SHOCT domain-containing protein [Streptomyces sp. B93]
MNTDVYLAYDYPLLSMFWTILWVFLWIMWFILLFRIIGDIFRDDSLGGWGKTGWLVFVVVLPFLGVFVYLIARGRDMGGREIAHAQAQQKAFDSYIRETAGGGKRPSSIDELARLSEMRTRGDITDEEFSRAKELVLSGTGGSEVPR